MEKSVLVTGATGFIGRAAVVALRADGWAVTQGLRDAAPSPRASGAAIHLDLNRPDEIIDMASRMRFDAIVHLGAKVSFAVEQGSDLFVPNVLSTGAIAYLAKTWQVPLVFASSVAVHGVRSEQIDLHTAIHTDTPYGKSKWLGEQLISAAGVPACILRIAGVFGAGGPAHLSLNRAIDEAIKGDLPSLTGTGEALRNYLYVKDAADAIVFALRNRVEGVHLLAGNEVLSIKEILANLCDVFLSGKHPLIQSGNTGAHQVIKASAAFPTPRGFSDAFADIRIAGKS